MPGILVSDKISDDFAKTLINLPSTLLKHDIDAGRGSDDFIPEEDTDYRDWLRTHNDFDTQFSAVTDFLAKASRENAEASEEIAMLFACCNNYNRLSETLNKTTDNNLKNGDLKIVQNSVEALLGENASAKGLSDAINDFNKKTNYKYVNDPAIKTMLVMADRVEQTADTLETYAINEYSKEVKSYFNAAKTLRNDIDETNRQYDELKKDYEDKHPGQDFLDINAVLAQEKEAKEKADENFNRAVKAQKKYIPIYNGIMEELANKEDKLKNLEENRERIKQAIAEEEEKLKNYTEKELKNDIDTKADNYLLEEMSKDKASVIRQYKGEELKKLNDSEEYEPIKDGLTSGIDNIFKSHKLAEEAKNKFETLSSQKDVNVMLFSDFAGRFKALYTKVYANRMLREAEEAKNSWFFTRPFLSKLPTAEEALQNTAADCLKNKTSFADAVSDIMKDLRTESKKEINQLGEKIGKKELYKEYSKKYDSIETIAEERYNKELAEQNNKRRVYADDKNKLQNSQETSKKFIDQLKTALQKNKKAIEAKQEEINNYKNNVETAEETKKYIETQKEERGALRQKTSEAYYETARVTRAIGNLHSEYLSHMQRIKDFRKNGLNVRHNLRPDRVNRRLEKFAARIQENHKEGHKNSPAYSAFIEKLREVQGTEKHNKKQFEELQKAAKDYMTAKGPTKFFSRTTFGERRFNFAKEVERWSAQMAQSVETKFPHRNNDDVEIAKELNRGNVLDKFRKLPVIPTLNEKATLENRNKEMFAGHNEEKAVEYNNQLFTME